METTAAATAKADASKPFIKKDLVAALAEQHHLSKRTSQKMLDDLIGMITKHLKKGERVKITGLGILQVRRHAARMGPPSGHRRGDQDLPRSRRPSPSWLTTVPPLRIRS